VRVLTPRLPATLALTALLLSIAGCSPEPAPPTATPSSPAAEPLFASDEEALAAAEAAYREYLESSGRVFASGGANVESLEEVAGGEVLEADRRRAREFQEAGRRIEGNTDLLDFRLQSSDVGGESWEVVAYACLDTFTIRVLDAQGNDIGDPTRERTVTYELGFSAQDQSQLLLIRSKFWDAGARCGD
jgi:hypothetical protein